METGTASQYSASPDGSGVEARPLPPLAISGVVVSKAQLMDALRLYVPSIVDISPLPDGQHFYILFHQDNEARQP